MNDCKDTVICNESYEGNWVVCELPKGHDGSHWMATDLMRDDSHIQGDLYWES
jgi:hypothetical protein